VKDREAIANTAHYVERLSRTEGSGHDWWHIKRVWELSKRISKREGGDLFVIEMAAILHDLDDWKFSKKEPTYRARRLMNGMGIAPSRIERVCHIIDTISFKGGFGETPKTIEGKIVQDADRIDALGAVGIARVFAFAGHKGRVIYDPEVRPLSYRNLKDYKKRSERSTAVNHFYEKLFRLEKQMNTINGRRIASERTRYMKDYLKRFMEEWEGER
jgi:uncharacterized protein